MKYQYYISATKNVDWNSLLRNESIPAWNVLANIERENRS